MVARLKLKEIDGKAPPGVMRIDASPQQLRAYLSKPFRGSVVFHIPRSALARASIPPKLQESYT